MAENIEWGSIDDFCRRFDSSRRQAYELIASGELDARKDGSRTKINMRKASERMERLPKAVVRIMPRPAKPRA